MFEAHMIIHQPYHTSTPPHARRAFGYILFMSVSLLVMVIGLSSLAVSRIRLRSAFQSRETATARACARSAIDVGFHMIQSDKNWRTQLGSGTWIDMEVVGTGVMTLVATRVVDADTDPLNDDWIFVATGASGASTQMIRVHLEDGMIMGTDGWRRQVN
jgi:hypothetical protein